MSKHIFLLFDLDLWPTTLTYNPSLAKVKVDPHAKIKFVGRTVQKLERKQTNTQTDGQMDATKRIISLASWSIDILTWHRYFSNKFFI